MILALGALDVLWISRADLLLFTYCGVFLIGLGNLLLGLILKANEMFMEELHIIAGIILAIISLGLMLLVLLLDSSIFWPVLIYGPMVAYLLHGLIRVIIKIEPQHSSPIRLLFHLEGVIIISLVIIMNLVFAYLAYILFPLFLGFILLPLLIDGVAIIILSSNRFS